MKRIFGTLFIISLAAITSAQVSITVQVTNAGGFRTALKVAGGNMSIVTNLTVTGNIDVRDIIFMCDSMPVLGVLDIETVQIKAYNGTGGTYPDNIYPYPANELPPRSFASLGALKTIKLPNSITSIREGAFYGCSGLTGSLTIPNSVTTIGSGAFSSCSGLTGSLTLPNSLKTLEWGTFGFCSGLTGQLIIPKTVTTIAEDVFYNCEGFTGEIGLSNSITSIGYSAFSGCKGLTGYLIIPNSIKTLNVKVFSDCKGLIGCYIPPSVTSFMSDGGSGAFSGCSGLQHVLVNKATPIPISNQMFQGVDLTTCELIVPFGSKAAYQAAEYWKDFRIITEAFFVILDTRGEYPVAPITTILTNSVISKPVNPVREGYTFVGWYKEANCTNEWNFDADIVTAPVTLYAKWINNPNSISHQTVSKLKFYPNPANDKLYIKNSISSNINVEFFDLQGKLVAIRQIGSLDYIDISNLTKGIYIVKIIDSGKTMISKFIKE